MANMRKRLCFIMVGILLVTISLVLVSRLSDKYIPILAIAFSLGLVALFDTLKRMLLDVAKRASVKQNITVSKE